MVIEITAVIDCNGSEMTSIFPPHTNYCPSHIDCTFRWCFAYQVKLTFALNHADNFARNFFTHYRVSELLFSIYDNMRRSITTRFEIITRNLRRTLLLFRPKFNKDSCQFRYSEVGPSIHFFISDIINDRGIAC